MRKYIVAIVLLVAIGIGFTLYLIPSDQEVAVLQSHDSTQRAGGLIEGAEGRFIEGDRSAPVLIGVADLYLQNGTDIRPLIPEYVTYLQTNPTDLSVRLRLAQMYRVSDDPRNYLAQMLILVEQAPNAQHLALLADAYNKNKAYPEQEQTLQKLIEITNGSNPEYYADLATIQALLGKDEVVLQTVKTLKERHPDYASYKITIIVVQAYVNSGQLEEAFTEANAWISREVEPQQIAELTNAIHYGGRPDLAVKLSEPHQSMAQEHPVLMMAFVNALVSHHEDARAYALLKERHQLKVLHSSLYYPLLRLAIILEPDYALPIVDEVKANQFHQDEALDLLELTYLQNTEALRSKLVVLFDVQPYTDDKDVLKAVIALIRRDNDEDARIEKALVANLPANERLRLAQACARNAKEACFNEVVSRYPAMPEMTPLEIDEIAELYIAARRSGEIKDGIYEQAQLRQLKTVSYSAARVAAANGDDERMTQWLQRDGVTASSTELAILYFIAVDSRQLTSSMLVAEALYQREPSARHREFLATSYVLAGASEKALPLLRQSLIEGDATQEDAYLAALVAVGGQDEAYRTELRDYVIPRLDSADITIERKYELIFSLINTRQTDVAKPYITQYAKSEGGDWQVLYNQVNAVATKGSSGKTEIALTDRPRDFRMKVATSPKTPESVKRMLAFSLLDDGYRDDAIAIFFDLAQTAPPKSQAMEDLLYLWGTRLNQEQMGWLTQRAANAPTQAERIGWAEVIMNQTDDFGMMQFVSDNPDMLNHSALRKRYFYSMAEHSEEDRFVAGMRPWVDATTDTAALQDYAAAAIAGTFPDGALYALRRITALDPNHQWALKQLTVMDYSRADYSEAKNHVERFIQNDQQRPAPVTSEANSYEVLYYKANLLRREGKNAEADMYFQQLVNMADKVADTAGEQALYYRSLDYLGHKDLARQGFTGLMETYPDDKGLLADFLDMLIESGEIEQAKDVANRYDNSAQTAQQSLPIDATNVQAIIPHNNGQELELRYDQEVPQQLIPEGAGQKAGWVEGMKQTKNSVLITAKAGHVLRFTPTADEYSQIVATPIATQTPQDRLEEQQQLRLQMLYARLELESGQTEQARSRMEAIRPHFGNDPAFLGYAANVENAAGNWPRAMSLIADAQQLQPDNEDIERLYRDMSREYGQEVKLDHTWRGLANNNEHITTLSGRLRPTHNTELGAILQNNDIDAEGVRHTNTGNIDDFDASRQRAELYGAYYFDNGDAARASLFSNNDTLGGGVSYSFNNALGRTEAVAEYKRPYWDFTQAAVDDATRNKIGANHIARIDDRTYLTGGVSLNQYNSSLGNNIASSTRVELYAARQVYDGIPKLSLGYGFDGEYFMDRDTRLSATGENYRTLPFVSREIHYPFVKLHDDIDEKTYAELTTGWAFDRYGGNGPQASGQVTHQLTEEVEAELRASYGIFDNDSNESITQVGGHLKYQF